MVVCKIVNEDFDGTLEYEQWYEGGRPTVYKPSLFSIGGSPFLLSVLIPLYSKAIDNLKSALTLVLSCCLNMHFGLIALSP